MTTPTQIPPGVDADAAALLVRAYALRNDEESRALYRDWAETYDATMLQGLNYQSPMLVAKLLATQLADRQAPVLDIGCGTGLAGQALAGYGFQQIDGLDLSPEMMQVAARRSVYRHLLTGDLNRPLAIADASYGGMSCCGTFTHGHVDARCLDELFRVLSPGAPFAFTVKREVWAPLGFRDKLAGMVERGQIIERVFCHDRHYSTSPEPDGVFCVYQRS
ncbi:MAG: hypothetical protein RIS90_1336 [Pseudomonadota bacterium]